MTHGVCGKQVHPMLTIIINDINLILTLEILGKKWLICNILFVNVQLHSLYKNFSII